MSILITGGAGAFGQAFAKYLLDNNIYERICIYSRDEWKHAQMRQKLNNDKRLRFFLGDVRDRERLSIAMRGVKVVVHGAALKRIEAGFYDPIEVVKTNINGTINVIQTSAERGVEKVILLSTDKAWQPISTYGRTKALAEDLFLNANHTYGQNGPKFACVRYGNVWGSTGSIGPVWKKLVSDGATSVPVTDPDCTRFFMTMDEAIHFVEHTINTAHCEQLPTIRIPDWLPAYRVGDLADALGVRMIVDGLPTWEKKHEGMRDDLISNRASRMTINELREALNEISV